MSWPERGCWYTLCEERDTVTKKVLEVLEKFEKRMREKLLEDAVTALFVDGYLTKVGDETYPADEIQTCVESNISVDALKVELNEKTLRVEDEEGNTWGVVSSKMLPADALYQVCRKHIPTKVEIEENGRKWIVSRKLDGTLIIIDIRLESLYAE